MENTRHVRRPFIPQPWILGKIGRDPPYNEATGEGVAKFAMQDVSPCAVVAVQAENSGGRTCQLQGPSNGRSLFTHDRREIMMRSRG